MELTELSSDVERCPGRASGDSFVFGRAREHQFVAVPACGEAEVA